MTEELKNELLPRFVKASLKLGLTPEQAAVHADKLLDGDGGVGDSHYLVGGLLGYYPSDQAIEQAAISVGTTAEVLNEAAKGLNKEDK